MKAMIAAAMSVALASAAQATTVFINEIHYDNTGGDTGEFVEIAAPAGTDLTGWSVVFYNGSNGTTYGTQALSGVIGDQAAGYGFATVNRSGIQNGSPDGLALVDATGNVVQFLSYEGQLTANWAKISGGWVVWLIKDRLNFFELFAALKDSFGKILKLISVPGIRATPVSNFSTPFMVLRRSPPFGELPITTPLRYVFGASDREGN